MIMSDPLSFKKGCHATLQKILIRNRNAAKRKHELNMVCKGTGKELIKTRSQNISNSTLHKNFNSDEYRKSYKSWCLYNQVY